ncbi:PREDICTED: nucleolin-like [Cyphomyrmex costatus]|uniref:nucleolin-like n=1 Tax=Cyphomyrmex costatus TaxID=456900 RepID=UPI0008523623|nr:PREDICTED: nucleolin-like [Cyphomyrmex costatus]
MELLSNEYHLIGPVVRPIKRNHCSLDCKCRTMDNALRRRRSVDDQRNGVCGCARFPKSPRQDLRSPREESRRTFIADQFEDLEPMFHSTKISADEKDDTDRRVREFDAGVSDIRNYRRRDDIEMEQRGDYVEPIPGPSRKVSRIPSPDPARNAKKVRVEGERVQRTNEKEEEDMDCTCDAEAVTRDERSRIRPADRPRVVRNGRRRLDAEEDEEDDAEEDEDKEEGIEVEEEDQDRRGGRGPREREEEEEDEEDQGDRVEEEDEDIEDSVYDELRARVPRRRTAARERELRRWIRRCREECERRRGR